MRVLLIEDNQILGAAIRDQIIVDGHGVDFVSRLDEAAEYMQATGYDLVLLDLMLPDGLGLNFLKTLRSQGDVTPVIILTALDQISDRIAGLDAGADDYMVKPFNLFELSARLKSVSRRYAGNPNPIISHGELEINLSTKSIHRMGKNINLTAKEWTIFETFIQRPDMLFSKTQLEDSLYAYDREIESNAIEVHISRLRKKLGKNIIRTARGVGYRLGDK